MPSERHKGETTADQRRRFHAVDSTWLVVPAVVAPLLLYIAIYVVLITPEPIPAMSGHPSWPRFPSYSAGGKYSETIFAPINWLDQTLFKRRWQYTEEDSNRSFNQFPHGDFKLEPSPHHGGAI